jgi:hypothetical protein
MQKEQSGLCPARESVAGPKTRSLYFASQSNLPFSRSQNDVRDDLGDAVMQPHGRRLSDFLGQFEINEKQTLD